jgi:hypothetical protein
MPGAPDWASRYPWARRVERWPDESLLDPPPPGVDPLATRGRHFMRFMAPRALWADGPWDEEPDLIGWTAEAGYPALMWRNHMGALCGYVGLPEGHVLHGLEYNSAELTARLDSHQGLTFSDFLTEASPGLGLPTDLARHWWIGFDCSHSGDDMPAMEALLSSIPSVSRSHERLKEAKERLGGDRWRETYKTVEFVRAWVEDLAQCVAHAASVAASMDETITRLSKPEGTEGQNERRETERDAAEPEPAATRSKP